MLLRMLLCLNIFVVMFMLLIVVIAALRFLLFDIVTILLFTFDRFDDTFNESTLLVVCL